MQGLQILVANPWFMEPMDISRPSSSMGISCCSGGCSELLPLAEGPHSLLVDRAPGTEASAWKELFSVEDVKLLFTLWKVSPPLTIFISTLSSSVRLLLQLEDRELVGSEVVRRTARKPATVTARGSDTCKNVFLLCMCESVQGLTPRPAPPLPCEVSEYIPLCFIVPDFCILFFVCFCFVFCRPRAPHPPCSDEPGTRKGGGGKGGVSA
mmetsp:Transcript_164530/g.523169  ORF Transcript_164530/g.523169 Transcript_164530/m.523169 type:complete len:210 (-) Transcript_164530:11-640(-)